MVAQRQRMNIRKDSILIIILQYYYDLHVTVGVFIVTVYITLITGSTVIINI